MGSSVGLMEAALSTGGWEGRGGWYTVGLVLFGVEWGGDAYMCELIETLILVVVCRICWPVKGGTI